MEGSVKMVRKEIGQMDRVWIHVAHDRQTCRALVKTVMNFRFQVNAENFLNSDATISFSRRTLFYGVGWFARFAS